MPVLTAVEDRGELVRGPAALRRCPGVGPVPVPGAVVPGRDEQRGEGGAGQFRVAARDHQCGHATVGAPSIQCTDPRPLSRPYRPGPHLNIRCYNLRAAFGCVKGGVGGSRHSLNGLAACARALAVPVTRLG